MLGKEEGMSEYHSLMDLHASNCGRMDSANQLTRMVGSTSNKLKLRTR